MKLFCHHYQLGARNGALIKVEFEYGLTGYADCHPWIELGDSSLHVQLEMMKKNQLTPLTSQSLKFAKIDADGREKKKHLLQSLQVPESHYLFMNLNETSKNEIDKAIKEGFDTFKVKVGKKIDEELKFLGSFINIPDTKWRLDFNNRLQPTRNLKLNKNGIEFIEDPFPYNNQWFEFLYPIASDRQEFAHEDSYQYKIHKPAVEEFKKTIKPIVVTSYLGHPLGQVADAFTAANLAKSYNIKVCGLLSHRVYPRNLFSEQLSWEGPKWKNPEGTGFGFDDILNSIKWQPL